MKPFLKAVLAGSFAAAIWPVAGFVGLGAVQGDWSFFLYLALFAAVVAMVFVLAAGLFVGLPAAYLLKHFNLESKVAYTSIGAAMGCLLMILPYFLDGNVEKMANIVIVGFFGAFSGAVTGWTWARSRSSNDC